jgi:uncharacterized membrane protein
MWAPYRKRLTRDLERWRSNGWISEMSYAAILDDVGKNSRELGLPSALAILASVLFGFAAISFVAAHWQDVPRLGRLALLLAGVWLGYGASGWLAMRNQRAFADAAILFAVAMFGASIMLISQMYNIDGSPPDGVLMWWIGALFAGVVLRSNPALALTLMLVCVWSSMETAERGSVHWPFLIGWGAVTAAFAWQRCRPGLHLSALALSFFVVSLGYLLGTGHEHALVAIAGGLAAAVAIAVERTWPEFETIAAPALGYAIAVTFAGLFALQFIESPSRSELVALAALTLVFLLAAIVYGVSTQNRGALWIGYLGFSIEILWLYWQTIGSILGTSLFFLIAALIVTALAVMALRLARGDGKGALA